MYPVILILIWLSVRAAAEIYAVHQVDVGETAILPCLSNDDDHRFQYWEMENDKIVGPWNNMNKSKYKYEVWSGRLIIKGVSTTESGFYKCISKKIKGADLNVKGIELVVKKDWEESYEHDSEANTYRAVIGVLVLLMVLLLGGMVFIMKKRKSDLLLGSDEISEEGRERPYSLKEEAVSTGGRIIRRSPEEESEEDALGPVETDLNSSFSLPDFR